MGGKSTTIVIHANALPNQQLYVKHLMAGAHRLGMNAVVSFNNVSQSNFSAGDINVCIGPHHAMTQCLASGLPTIYIDRCLWGDDLEYVTIGWLNPYGGMVYPTDAPGDRPKPPACEWRHGINTRVLLLADYGPYPDQLYKSLKTRFEVTLRPHPATGRRCIPLAEDLLRHHFAIGYRTSALTTAVLHGVPVVCLDSRNAVYPVASDDILHLRRPDRSQWLNNISYAQWSGREIASGDALNYVLSHPYTPAHTASQAG